MWFAILLVYRCDLSIVQVSDHVYRINHENCRWEEYDDSIDYGHERDVEFNRGNRTYDDSLSD